MCMLCLWEDGLYGGPNTNVVHVDVRNVSSSTHVLGQSNCLAQSFSNDKVGHAVRIARRTFFELMYIRSMKFLATID